MIRSIFRHLVLRTPEYLICAVAPLAILEYKYNRSHDELLANVLREDYLLSNPPMNKEDIEAIRHSSNCIRHWQSFAPVQQLFKPIPKRWKKD